MSLVAFALALSAFNFIANGQLTLSPINFTVVEGASFRVTCNHPAGADVFLSGLTSSISVAAGIHDTVFTVSNVSRTDNNKQFFCSQVVVEPSPPALLTVYYLSEEPLFSSNLVVVSTPGDFFLNISIVANPFVIPANITVQNPPGVTLPAFSVIQIGDRGTAYIKLDQFQLPKYAGSYVITLRHPAVSAAVIQFNLTVRYAPRYAYSPTNSNTTVDIFAVQGSAQSLSCAVTGVPQPTVVGLNSIFSSATNSYTFAAVSSSDAGLYVCVATNNVGSNTITYRLNIGVAPRYTYGSTLSNATVDIFAVQGSAQSLSCAVTGVPQPTVVGLNSTFSSATNSYTFAAVSSSDAGLYACVASNNVGSNTITYRLNIGVAPRYTYGSTLSNATVYIVALQGSAQSLSCAVTGVPQPTIVGLNSTFSSATNSYTFAAVSFSDAGLYVCVATNNVGSNTITYRLIIKAPPTRSSEADVLCSTFLCILISAILVILF